MPTKRVLLILSAALSILFAANALAKDQVLTWEAPTQDCDGDAILPITGYELVIDTSPMPMPSDSSGPCSATADPDAPASATVYNPGPAATSFTVDLPGNQAITYYTRIRVYVESGERSAWSSQAEFVVAPGKPGPPIFLTP